MDEHGRAVRTADFNISTLAEHFWSAEQPVDWKGISVPANCLEHHFKLIP